MKKTVYEEVLNRIFVISLKTRILREWQKNHAARQPKYSERDILVLELVKDYAPITAIEIGNVFGLAPSSVNQLIKNLEAEKLIELCSKEQTDNREKPLKLSNYGDEQLEQVQQSNSLCYEYLLKGLDEKKLSELMPILEKIHDSVSITVRHLVFQQFA